MPIYHLVKPSLKSLLYPFLILCVVTVYSVLSLFYPEKIALNFKKSQTGLVQLEQLKDQRQIASVEEMQTLTVGCEQPGRTHQVSTSQILLRFEDCENEKKIVDFKLVNSTNSYMAQIFHSAANVIATDFIQLAKGENILNLEISLNDKQKKTQIIKIERISTEIQ
jgi:hypothetical protein